MLYFVFEKFEEAKMAEEYISKILFDYPQPGINAKTGCIDTDKQYTEKYAEIEQRTGKDYKYVFPALEIKQGMSFNQIDFLYNNFNFELEIKLFDDKWFFDELNPVEQFINQVLL